MVFAVGEDGHLELVSAHDRHAREHSNGARHDHHESPADPDHERLHAALADASDAGTGKLDHRSVGDPLASPFDAVVWFIPIPPPRDVTVETGRAGVLLSHFFGSTARIEITSIRAIVLLV